MVKITSFSLQWPGQGVGDMLDFKKQRMEKRTGYKGQADC